MKKVLTFTLFLLIGCNGNTTKPTNAATDQTPENVVDVCDVSNLEAVWSYRNETDGRDEMYDFTFNYEHGVEKTVPFEIHHDAVSGHNSFQLDVTLIGDACSGTIDTRRTYGTGMPSDQWHREYNNGVATYEIDGDIMTICDSTYTPQCFDYVKKDSSVIKNDYTYWDETLND